MVKAKAKSKKAPKRKYTRTTKPVGKAKRATSIWTPTSKRKKRKYTRKAKPTTSSSDDGATMGLTEEQIAILKRPLWAEPIGLESPLKPTTGCESPQEYRTTEDRTLAALIETNRVTHSMLHLFHSDLVTILHGLLGKL